MLSAPDVFDLGLGFFFTVVTVPLGLFRPTLMSVLLTQLSFRKASLH